MAAPRMKNCYPRRGERIAPYILRDFLAEPIPKRLLPEVLAELDATTTSPSVAPLQLAALDEALGKQFSDETLVKLGQAVVKCVAECQTRAGFQHRRLPMPPDGMILEDLHLESRTRRCLAREGFDVNPQTLGQRTMGEILAVRAFGPRCLVDLLTALEARRIATWGDDAISDTRRERSEELTLQSQRLADLTAARSVRRDDPRFARLMEPIEGDVRTARDAAERLLSRSEDPPDPAYIARQIAQLVALIEAMPRLTLEQELIEIFVAAPRERNCKIVIGYYGWEDGKTHTLTEIGKRIGITRERVRQICTKLTRRPKGLTILAPAMDRALALIQERIPCRVADLETELAESALTAVGMSLASVAVGAKLLGRPIPFKMVTIDSHRLAVRADQVEAAMAIADLAKKEIYFHGLATVAMVGRGIGAKHAASTDAQLLMQTLQSLDHFRWLDEAKGWFYLTSIMRHGLPKVIDKILAVAGEVTVAQMGTAMARNRRLWKTPPPENVLLEYCRQRDGIRVESNRIAADPPRDWKETLTGVEAKLVDVLSKHGPVMERGTLEDLCVEGGVNRFSFHAFVSWSPVIAQFGHSIYGLLGTNISQEQVDILAAKRLANRPRERVLGKHGRIDDGKVWLSYRLSKAASTYAVITIPAALKAEVDGRFAMVDGDGNEIGTLATKAGRAWGLGPFMRQQNAKVGDYVVITLDLENRTAVVELGKEPKSE